MYGRSIYSVWVEKYGIDKASTLLSELKNKTSISLKERFKDPKCRKQISEGLQRYIQNNREKFIESRRKAGKISASSQYKYKINKLETDFMVSNADILKGFEYSVILGGYQFDWGMKENRILIELQGDYWHGNPRFFGDEGLRILNQLQITKINRDMDKKKFASDNNLKLFCIWEYDFRNRTEEYNKIIEEIKCYLNLN